MDFNEYLEEAEKNNPIKCSKDESDVENSFFFVQMKQYIDLFFLREDDLNFTKEDLLKMLFGRSVSKMYASDYIKSILLHYFETNVPHEEYEAFDKNDFPSDKELKRFLWIQYYNRFDLIDQYLNFQPKGKEREKELKKLHMYYRFLLKLAFEYYPQLNDLPSRGLLEFERTFYTINYLYYLDINEARDRVSGKETEYTKNKDKILKNRKELNEKKKKNKPKEEDPLKKFIELSPEEQSERIVKIRSREIKRGRFIEFHFQFIEKLGKSFLKLFPDYDVPLDDFLVKASYTCSLITEVGFYNLEDILDHYKQSDKPYPKEIKRTKYDDAYYLYLNAKGVLGDKFDYDKFIVMLDEYEISDLKYTFKILKYHKSVLKFVNEFYPQISSLPASGLREVSYCMEFVSDNSLREMHSAESRVNGEHSDYYEKMQKEIEEDLRKKENSIDSD